MIFVLRNLLHDVYDRRGLRASIYPELKRFLRDYLLRYGGRDMRAAYRTTAKLRGAANGVDAQIRIAAALAVGASLAVPFQTSAQKTWRTSEPNGY
jgi:hypothetical protein